MRGLVNVELVVYGGVPHIRIFIELYEFIFKYSSDGVFHYENLKIK